MKKALILSICFIIGINLPTNAQLSPAEIKSYISKSITVAGLNDLCKTSDAYYDSLWVVHPVEFFGDNNQDVISGVTFQRYQDMLRLIADTKAKFITDAVTQWGSWQWPFYLRRCQLTVRDIKSIDPDIVVQGSLNEYIRTPMLSNVGLIPEWVFTAFDLEYEERKFDMYQMAYPDYKSNPNHRWSDKIDPATDDYEDAIPDISRLESKLWFYYQARVFIDFGCESISFSQVELMNQTSNSPEHWKEVFDKVRAYAAESDAVRFMMISGHTDGMKDTDGRLLFDLHLGPSRIQECGPLTNPNGGDGIIKDTPCVHTSFNNSMGGLTPSGYVCDHTPMLIFIDNKSAKDDQLFGQNRGPCTYSPYHFDEITWFAMQPETYRNQWLRYAYHAVHDLDNDAYVALPVKRVISPTTLWSPDSYYANKPDSILFPTPLTVNDVPIREGQLIYAGYGQEATIKSIFNFEVKTKETDTALFVYPNPACCVFNIQIKHKAGSTPTMKFYNTMGKLIFEKQLFMYQDNTIEYLDAHDWNNGVYLLQLSDAEGKTIDQTKLFKS